MTNRNAYMVTFIASAVLAFLSPPFIFGYMDFASRELRAGLGIIVIILFIIRINRISVYDIYALLYVIFLLSVELLWQRSELSNILSYYAVVLVYIILFIVLKNNILCREVFFRLWLRIAYFISISSIILFALHQFTSLNTDFLNFSSLGEFSNRNYRYSILGVTTEKNYGLFTVSRVYSYFVEPQFAALYFTLNILLFRVIDDIREYRWWISFNVLAGLLTFSVTFYMAMVAFMLMQSTSMRIKVIAALLLTAVTVFIISGDLILDNISLLSHTSYSDRVIRLLNSIDIIENASIQELLFGHGVNYKSDSDLGISLGVFHLLVERGLMGLMFVLAMLTFYLNKDRVILIICLFFLIANTWYVNYIFWMAILMLWVGGKIANKQQLYSNNPGLKADAKMVE